LSKAVAACITYADATLALLAPARRPIVPGMGTRETGFSLTESVVTLAVLASVAAVGVSSIGDIVEGLRLQAVAADIFEPLLLARSEAIKRNTRVAVCMTADGRSCSTGGGWEQGWIVFQDGNNSGSREPNEPVLQWLQHVPAGFRIRANAPVGHYVSYGPLGRTRLASGAFQAGTFTVCRISSGPVEGRQVIINAGGRPRVQKVRLEGCS
jgi:type IV fimbrial biogenesis protein FimT